MFYLWYYFVSYAFVMQYQLPNGKVLNLSVEEYLSLTDDELQNLVATEPGEEPSYKIHHSRTLSKEKTPVNFEPEISEEVDPRIDYDLETDETDVRGPLNYDDLPDELVL